MERSDIRALGCWIFCVVFRTEHVAYRYCVTRGTIYNTCMDQRNGESNMIEVFAKEPSLPGKEGERVVITYLQSGYRLPVPMIDGDVHTVSDEVADSFVGASMWGWTAPIADVAHEWVKENFPTIKATGLAGGSQSGWHPVITAF